MWKIIGWNTPISKVSFPLAPYGAGTVMVWDRGRWIPDGDPKAAYEKGRLKFTLVGRKLPGRWTLVRMDGRHRDENYWLLIKERDGAFRTVGSAGSTLAMAKSVKSGMSMDEIAKAKSDTWHSYGQSTRSEQGNK